MDYERTYDHAFTACSAQYDNNLRLKYLSSSKGDSMDEWLDR